MLQFLGICRHLPRFRNGGCIRNCHTPLPPCGTNKRSTQCRGAGRNRKSAIVWVGTGRAPRPYLLPLLPLLIQGMGGGAETKEPESLSPPGLSTQRTGFEVSRMKSKGASTCTTTRWRGCAGGGNRTRKGFRPEIRETSAFANFATPALIGYEPWQAKRRDTGPHKRYRAAAPR